jgi:ribonuclease R
VKRGRSQTSETRKAERRRPQQRAIGRPERGVVCASRRGFELRGHPDDGTLRVRLHDADLRVPGRGRRLLAPGDVVALRYEGRGRVRPGERLGRVGDPDLDFLALQLLYGLPEGFPAACLEAPPARSREAARLDLTALPFVTIDPARARDHDDAVFAEPAGASIRLWVAIADVAHFVAAGSALDREAKKRGNSVYLPDRVVPMLPEALSADLCSLRPDEERFVMAVELAVARDGSVETRGIEPARIRSHAKLSYEEAAARMAHGEGRGAVSQSLAALAVAAKRLRAQRLAAGSLDLDLVQAEASVDARGRGIAIAPAARTEAHRAIEEAMLAANRAVAERLTSAGWPALHRVHEPPDPHDLAALEPVLASLGLWSGRRRRAPEAADLPGIVEAARERGAPAAVHSLLVRALKQARYSDQRLGHFALAFPHYLHFTSPIRRYADLVVHRLLKAHLAGERPPRRALAALGEHLSLRERAAAAAEYQALDWKRAALLLGRVGEQFDGRVSGIAAPGLFVTLEEVCGDGLVPAFSLGSGARLDLRSMCVQRGRSRLRLGDEVRVRLVGVDPALGRFRLALADQAGASGSASRLRRSHSG